MAERHYQRHLRMFPDDAALWVQLGHARKERGCLSLAAIAYQRALYLRPYDADLHVSIGHLHKMQGYLPGAVAAFRRALELYPGMPAARAALAQAECGDSMSPQARIDALEAQLVAVRQRLAMLESGTGPGESPMIIGPAPSRVQDL